MVNKGSEGGEYAKQTIWAGSGNNPSLLEAFEFSWGLEIDA